MRTSGEERLIAHWPLEKDGEELCGLGAQTKAHRIEFSLGARFNGIDSGIELQDHPALNFGTGDFSVAAWIQVEDHADVVGDIISKFDPETRRGFSLGVVSASGITSSSQPNYRNVHFGIDHGQLDEKWSDCGRPGRAVHVMALGLVKGQLHAGTFEKEAAEQGHLWRYAGGRRWIDLGATPDGSNSVPSVVEFDGALHCTTGKYNPVGSRLGPALNTKSGGRVWRVETEGRWTDCGKPGAEDAVADDATVAAIYETGKADEATSLTVYRGELYVTSHHRRGAFKYEGGKNWKYIGPDERLFTFTVFQDRLYALVNGKSGVYRYEGGAEWTSCGNPAGSEQVYAAITYGGKLHVGTWPDGDLFRYDGGQAWTNLGRTGYEREIMALSMYNGKLYAGSLPMANVWRLDSKGFTFVGNLDNTDTVCLRRVWSMAVYRGKLFAGTLPSGRVLSMEAGRMASSDRALASGWRHLAAVREGGRLRLYIDGRSVAESSAFSPGDYDLRNDQPLRIGFGVGHPFRGAMRDLRLYRRALTPREIAGSL
jgi:hypothetical protein